MEQSAKNQGFTGLKRLPVLDSELLKTFVAIAESGSSAVRRRLSSKPRLL